MHSLEVGEDILFDACNKIMTDSNINTILAYCFDSYFGGKNQPVHLLFICKNNLCGWQALCVAFDTSNELVVEMFTLKEIAENRMAIHQSILMSDTSTMVILCTCNLFPALGGQIKINMPLRLTSNEVTNRKLF